MNVRLEQFEENIPQTTWWAPSNGYPLKRWWVLVNDMRLRPANEIEIELWEAMLSRKRPDAPIGWDESRKAWKWRSEA